MNSCLFLFLFDYQIVVHSSRSNPFFKSFNCLYSKKMLFTKTLSKAALYILCTLFTSLALRSAPPRIKSLSMHIGMFILQTNILCLVAMSIAMCKDVLPLVLTFDTKKVLQFTFAHPVHVRLRQIRSHNWCDYCCSRTLGMDSWME